MLATIVTARYQDYLFVEGSSRAQQANSVNVQVPRGRKRNTKAPAGATLSHLMVMINVNVHCIVICITIIWFAKGTPSLPAEFNYMCFRELMHIQEHQQPYLGSRDRVSRRQCPLSCRILPKSLFRKRR
jgi:hypothetical protein